MKGKEVQPQSNTRTTTTDRLVHREKTFKHYRGKDIPKAFRLSNKQEFVDICNKLWEVTADKLIDNKAGVFLDDFGYLCIWTPATKRVSENYSDKEGLGIYFNTHTNGRFYFPDLISDTLNKSKNFLKCWSLDRAFNSSLKKRINVKLRTGHKYKFYPMLVKGIKNKR